MRAGMQLLLRIVRGAEDEACGEAGDWAATLELAEEEGLLPWLAARVRPLDLDWPAAIGVRLEEIDRAAALASFFWSAELKSILRAFDTAGLRVIALKGPSLAGRLYGNASLRTSRDLDLLVPAAELQRARMLLADEGFRASAQPDDYHQPWLRGTTTVELHHDVENPLAFAFDLAGAWVRAREAKFQGVPCRLLAPPDELLFLALHAVRHRFERLSLLLDLRLAFERLEAPASLDPALADVLSLGREMARKLDSELEGPEIEPRLGRLADGLWEGLMQAPGETLDWRMQHRFYLELARPGWPRLVQRLRHGRILLTRAIEPDFAFAASFGLHRRWQVRLLRPIRLLTRRPKQISAG